MFKITTNRNIVANRGDGSNPFPVFLNKGKLYTPLRYYFRKDLNYEANITVELFNESKFRTAVGLHEGRYRFDFHDGSWYVNDYKLDKLEDFGIQCSWAEEGSYIDVFYKDTGEELTFYLLDNNLPFELAIVEKTFKRNGDVITRGRNRGVTRKFNRNKVVNDDGDMLIYLDSDDTNLPIGLYEYMIRAKLYSDELEDFLVSTVVDRHPFYIE